VDTKIAGMCQKILSVEPAMWTFVRVVGVEPTNRDYIACPSMLLAGGRNASGRYRKNNDGERSLRHAVLWRK
jgi:hypothetical protein